MYRHRMHMRFMRGVQSCCEHPEIINSNAFMSDFMIFFQLGE